MKKILIIILLSLIMIPNLVKAETYDETVKSAKSYILNSNYRNTYDRYLITNTENLYKESTDEEAADEKFDLGGLLSYNEFQITLDRRKPDFSYLYDGINYWTYTKKDNEDKDSEVYVVSNEIDKLLEKENIVPKTRVTEYIKPETMVEGSGTRNDPWVFVPIYQVVIKTNDHGKIYLKSGNSCNGGSYSDKLNVTYKNKKQKINICLVADSGYKYVSNTCSAFSSVKDDTLTITNVTKDLNCTVEFGKETFKIDLDQSNVTIQSQPNKIYLVYSQGWYKDVTGLTTINKLDQNPTRTGYTFGGYQTTNADGKNVQVIDSNSKIINNDETLKLFQKDGTLSAIWILNQYNIVLNPGSDVASVGTTKITTTYDLPMPKITVPTKVGYIFNGYYTGTNGSGTKYYNADGSSASNWNISEDTTLYAYWTICPAGTYAQAGAKTCTKCVAGTYSIAGSSSCTKCVAGTYAQAGASSCTNCAAGTYSKDGSSSCTKCSVGTYSGQKASSCTKCPGCKTTATTGATSESACFWNYGDGSLNTVSGGYQNHLQVNCNTGTLHTPDSQTVMYGTNNYQTEDWVVNSNHGYCSDDILSTYGFKRYWMSTMATKYIDSIPVTSKTDNYASASETCNKSPLYDDIIGEWGKIEKGTSINYTFKSSISGERTVFLNIRGGGATYDAYIGGLKFNVNGSYYTLKQMVDNKYIKPIVILDGHSIDGYSSTFDLYDGGTSGKWILGETVVMFMTNSGYTISGFQLTSNKNFAISYPDYGGDVIVNDGYYLRHTDISNWRMTYK